MTLAHARALLPFEGTHIEAFDPRRDETALRALASWGGRFSPLVAPDPPDGLLMDITGCAHLFRGERAMLTQVVNRSRRLGFRARAATASTFGCAWALARFQRKPGIVIRDGQEREALRQLPVRGLRIDEDIEEALFDVGIERIGELFDLPRASLPSRFGDDLLLRLDQALGRAMEMIEPVRPTPPLRVDRHFDGPTKHTESIEVALRGLIDLLCQELARLESGVRRLEIELERSDMTPASISIRCSYPSRDPKHLWTLIGPRFEKTHLGFGVEGLSLTAARVGRLPHRQAQRWRDEDGARDRELERELGMMLDALTSRLGEDRITRVEPVETHVPERAYRHLMISADAPKAEAIIASGDRPTKLFDTPERIEVLAMTPDGPPSWMRWRGREMRIAMSVGPERITGEWWRWRTQSVHRRQVGEEFETVIAGALRARDYFRVQEEAGRWIWVFRDHGQSRWFAHGEWV